VRGDCVFDPRIDLLLIGIQRGWRRDFLISTELYIGCKGIARRSFGFNRTDVSIVENCPLEIARPLVSIDNSAWFVYSKNLL
jgi:hypothetical protein